jgi:hypothetical protein
MKQGYGEGFRQYAAIQNVKEMAKTLMFLQANGVGTYAELIKKDNDVVRRLLPRERTPQGD